MSATADSTNIDATWGGTAANAYDTMANVNAFIHTHVFDHSDWDNLTKEQKEAAILEATRDIDAGQYIGSRYARGQVLEFPRELSLDWPNNATGSLTSFSEAHERMQRDVQRALAHQALWIVRNGGRNYHAEAQAQGVKQYSESVGPIREQYTYGAAAPKRLCPEAEAKLAPWREPRRVYRG
jgi:hypothetical protein